MIRPLIYLGDLLIATQTEDTFCNYEGCHPACTLPVPHRCTQRQGHSTCAHVCCPLRLTAHSRTCRATPSPGAAHPKVTPAHHPGCAEVQIPEARAFYAFQSAIESVHSEMYGLLLEQYIRDKEERDMLFHAVDTIPCVREWQPLLPFLPTLPY